MRITHARSPGEMTIVDLLKSSTLSQDGWLKPIEFEITEPPTIYVRIPNGRFAVRVMTSSDTEIMIHVDGAMVLETKVGKGIHLFDRDAEGRLFNFGENQATKSSVTKTVQRTRFDTEEAASCLTKPGQVAVLARLCKTNISTPCPPAAPDYLQSIFFQMNPPGAHEETCAELLSKMKSPPRLTAAEHRFGEYSDAEDLLQRLCCNCPHDQQH